MREFFGAALAADWVARFCKKSKPGTNFPKPAKEELSASLINVSPDFSIDCACKGMNRFCAGDKTGLSRVLIVQRSDSALTGVGDKKFAR
jgi:hypothetical protein